MADTSPKSKTVKLTFDVGGMSCATCAGGVEATLAQTPSIAQARVNFANSRANQWFSSHVPLAGNPAPFPWRAEEHGTIAIQLSESKLLHVEKAVARPPLPQGRG